MSKVRIELNREGVAQLLKSPEIQADIARRAQAIAATAAGSGGTFEVRTKVGRSRAHATVITTDVEARKAEATDRALTRAIDAGRA